MLFLTSSLKRTVLGCLLWFVWLWHIPIDLQYLSCESHCGLAGLGVKTGYSSNFVVSMLNVCCHEAQLHQLDYCTVWNRENIYILRYLDKRLNLTSGYCLRTKELFIMWNFHKLPTIFYFPPKLGINKFLKIHVFPQWIALFCLDVLFLRNMMFWRKEETKVIFNFKQNGTWQLYENFISTKYLSHKSFWIFSVVLT